MTVFCAFIIDVPIGFVKKIYKKKPFEENVSRIGHGDRGKEPFPPRSCPAVLAVPFTALGLYFVRFMPFL